MYNKYICFQYYISGTVIGLNKNIECTGVTSLIHLCTQYFLYSFKWVQHPYLCWLKPMCSYEKHLLTMLRTIGHRRKLVQGDKEINTNIWYGRTLGFIYCHCKTQSYRKFLSLKLEWQRKVFGGGHGGPWYEYSGSCMISINYFSINCIVLKSSNDQPSAVAKTVVRIKLTQQDNRQFFLTLSS